MKKKKEQKISKLPYIKFATNNLLKVLSDPKGARCVYCMGSPLITKDTDTIDINTIICPDCTIDAVVPASCVPNEETLKKWHQLGFGGKSNKIKPFKIDDNCNIWYMNGNVSDLDNWEINIKNNYVTTWSNNGKNDSVESKIKIGDIIAWYIVSKGYNSILKVIDNPHKITDEIFKLTMTEEQIKNKKEKMKYYNYSIVTIPVEFLATTTTNFIKKDNINDYTGEWSGGLRGCHCIKPNNPRWKELVVQIYNNLK